MAKVGAVSGRGQALYPPAGPVFGTMGDSVISPIATACAGGFSFILIIVQMDKSIGPEGVASEPREDF